MFKYDRPAGLHCGEGGANCPPEGSQTWSAPSRGGGAINYDDDDDNDDEDDDDDDDDDVFSKNLFF